MTTSLSEETGLESLIRDRATRLFTYLKELTALRSDVKRNCDEYEQVIWWGEIPREKECHCAAWDLGRESAYEDWIRIERPHRKSPPNPPPTLAPWLSRRDLADSSLDAPPLKESIVEELDGSASGDQVERQTVIRRLEDHPAITRQWELYVENLWWPWALEDRRLETIQSVYNQLFAAYQMQDRLGEAYEVVVGAGLLTWKPPHGPNVRRHVAVSQATVEFDSKSAVISVAPAAAGARLALEQDMLEPQDRPLPEVQNQIQQQLSGIGDEIWSGPELINSLNAYFHQLTPENALSLALEPSNGTDDPARPSMALAPALIVRKRTEGNLVRIFDEIASQLKSGGLVPSGVERLVSISDDTASGDGRDGLEGDHVPEELYFPLRANEAQLQIARKLQGRQGVLVQGPPGTGKSHTITNLVCHLLATGQKLLVTSHTARALRVLKNYFPADVSPLCVFLMGDDTAALHELEESVQGILNRLNTWDTGTSRAHVRKLQSGLDHSRRELAEAYTSLKQIRAGETQSFDLGYGGYQGSPQALAERLAEEAAEFEWVTGANRFDGPPPLTNSEALELLSLVREFGSGEDNDVTAGLPELGSLLEPQLFNDLVLKEKEIVARIESVDGGDRPILGSLADLDRATRESLAVALRDLCTALDSFAQRPEAWIGAAVRDVVLGKHHTWEQLRTITINKVNAVASRISKVSEMKLSGLEQRDLANVRADAEMLQARLGSGKGVSSALKYNPLVPKRVRAALYLVDKVRVDGRPCDSSNAVGDLLDFIEVTKAIEYLDQQWTPYVQAVPTPVLLSFREHERRADVLAEILRLRQLAPTLQAGLSRARGLAVVDLCDRQVVSKIIGLLRIVTLEDELRDLRQGLARIQKQLASFQRGARAHPVIGDLSAAIEARDLPLYSRAFEQLVNAWRLRTRSQRREALNERLGTCNLAERVSSNPLDHSWDKCLASFDSAWNWARADIWLRLRSDPGTERAILQKIDIAQERIRHDLGELAAYNAWEYVLARLKPEQREHLMAWKLAIKKIGKGTGKYATQHRREARYHLEYCRGAIPAWVMPIFRVAETTKPQPNLFDVAIIDEASQSGPEALFLSYIAKKIVVVGDDQQISPESVGMDREAVDSLQQRYIKDVPHCDALGVDNSFFDQAQIRFSARIRLREHFRCMPEIIQFSNNLCYEAEPLIPLRQYGLGRLAPVTTRHVRDGYAKGTGDRIVNRPEAEAIVDQIVHCIADPAYEGKTFGVISLQGSAQWNLIRDLLLDRIGAQEMQRRRLAGGNAYAFQGDERDVIFLSMVAATNDGRHVGVLSKEPDKRRFNVAASRARDQMWLFHSLTVEDLSVHCFRRQLLEYCLNPTVKHETVGDIEVSRLRERALQVDRADSRPPLPFDSWFEVDVFLRIIDRGFRVIPQYSIAGKFIDLLVEGMQGRLAVECDGDEYHGIDQWDADMDRQRMLERCGLEFWRIRGSVFYRSPDSALDPLWRLLRDRGIHATAADTHTAVDEPACNSPEEQRARDSQENEFDDEVSATSIVDESATDAVGIEPEIEVIEAPSESQPWLFGSNSHGDLPITLAPYVHWVPDAAPDPNSVSLPELMEGLIAIAAVEGPMICHRAYLLYNRAAGNARLGSQIVRLMNRAMYRAVRLGRLEQSDERRRGGQINQIVRIAGTPEAVVRQRGPRKLEEIPPLEIKAVRDAIFSTDPSLGEDQLVRSLARIYEVGRITAQTRKLLLG